MLSNVHKVVHNHTILFYFSLLIGLIRYFPPIVSSITGYTFVLLSVIRLLYNKKKIHIHSIEIPIYVTIFVFFILSLMSNEYTLAVFLASCQLIVINYAVLLNEDIKYAEYFQKFMSILEKTIYIGITYSALLLSFGQLQLIDGRWINFLFFSFINQEAHGIAGELGYSSFFTNPNPFAFFIAVVLLWKIVNFEERKLISYSQILLLFLGLRIADSRAGDICSVIALLVVIYFKYNSVRIRKSLFVVSLVSVIVLLFSYFNEFLYIINNIDLAGRTEKWELLISGFYDSPIIGNGYSSSTKSILKNVSVGTFSSYLTIMAEEGLIGLVCVTLSYLYIIFKMVSLYNNSRNLMCLFAITYTIQLGVLGIVEDVWFNVTSRFLFFLVVIKVAYYSYQCEKISNSKHNVNLTRCDNE